MSELSEMEKRVFGANAVKNAEGVIQELGHGAVPALASVEVAVEEKASGLLHGLPDELVQLVQKAWASLSAEVASLRKMVDMHHEVLKYDAFGQGLAPPPHDAPDPVVAAPAVDETWEAPHVDAPAPVPAPVEQPALVPTPAPVAVAPVDAAAAVAQPAAPVSPAS